MSEINSLQYTAFSTEITDFKKNALAFESNKKTQDFDISRNSRSSTSDFRKMLTHQVKEKSNKNLSENNKNETGELSEDLAVFIRQLIVYLKEKAPPDGEISLDELQDNEELQKLMQQFDFLLFESEGQEEKSTALEALLEVLLKEYPDLDDVNLKDLEIVLEQNRDVSGTIVEDWSSAENKTIEENGDLQEESVIRSDMDGNHSKNLELDTGVEEMKALELKDSRQNTQLHAAENTDKSVNLTRLSGFSAENENEKAAANKKTSRLNLTEFMNEFQSEETDSDDSKRSKNFERLDLKSIFENLNSQKEENLFSSENEVDEKSFASKETEIFQGITQNSMRRPHVSGSLDNQVIYGDQLQGEKIIKQIEEKTAYLTRSSENQMEIQLEPESLGKVRVDLKVEDGQITLDIKVENQMVKTELEHNLHLLRSNFLRQGFNVDHVQVETGSYEQTLQEKNGQSQDQNQGQYYQPESRQGREENGGYQDRPMKEMVQLIADEEGKVNNIFYLQNYYRYSYMDLMA